MSDKELSDRLGKLDNDDLKKLADFLAPKGDKKEEERPSQEEQDSGTRTDQTPPSDDT